MGADLEDTAEVRQPLLTVQVMLAGAGPGALQQIGSDLAQGCAIKPGRGLARRRFQLGIGTSTAGYGIGRVARRQPIRADN